MSDFDAIYSAVRSRIAPTNSDDVYRAALEAFDISHIKPILSQEICVVSGEMTRASVLYRPRIFIDGSMWCALYGDNLQDGVAGFGQSPAEAMTAFDQAWRAPRPHIPAKEQP